jgi:Ser/Thr protein kinase RdoA (MazF antagonist)
LDRRSEDIFETHRVRILDDAARRYGVNRDDLEKKGSFESQVFEYQRDGQRYIMKLTHRLHRTPELVEGEVDWILHLDDCGVSVCRPVPSKAGKLIEVIDGSAVGQLGDDYFIVYAFEKAPGRGTTRTDWSDDMVTAWGRTLGRMHRATREYHPAREDIRRFRWDTDPGLNKFACLESQPKIIDKWREIIERLKSFPADDGGYGLIHSDLHHGNFFLSDGHLHVFDCDDCHYGWLGFDIMIPLFYVMRHADVNPNDTEYARRYLDRFLTGYRSETDVDGVWIRRIPDFMKLRELDLYTILIDEDFADGNDWCRRFMDDRRNRIENDVPVLDLNFSEFA